MFFAGLHGLEIEGPGLRFAHNAVALAAPGDQHPRQGSAPRGQAAAGRVRGGQDATRSCCTRAARRQADRLHATTRFNALAEPFLSEGTLRLQPGDQVLELLPNVDWAKGDAVRAIIRHDRSAH